jgi:hypothetical protein
MHISRKHSDSDTWFCKQCCLFCDSVYEVWTHNLDLPEARKSMEAGKSIKAGRIFAIEMDKQLRGFGNGRSPRQPDLVEEMMAALDEALSDVSFSPVRQDSEEE